MRRFSSEWFDAVAQDRFAVPWSTMRGPRLPTMPWVKVPLNSRIRELFDKYGEVLTFEPEEKLFPTSRVTHFHMVSRGITGRIAASPDAQSSSAMALSSPGRLACGNLNWSTHRPAIGRYKALSNVEVKSISHIDFDDLLFRQDDSNELLKIMMTQFELGNLSDRLGFAIVSLLGAHQRLQALYLAWAVFYGKITCEGGRDVVTMPSPGRRAHIEAVISVSSVTMDKLSTQIRDEAAFKRDGDFISLDASWLQSIHQWMRESDGSASLYPRPARVEDFLYGVQEGDYF